MYVTGKFMRNAINIVIGNIPSVLLLSAPNIKPPIIKPIAKVAESKTENSIAE